MYHEGVERTGYSERVSEVEATRCEKCGASLAGEIVVRIGTETRYTDICLPCYERKWQHDDDACRFCYGRGCRHCGEYQGEWQPGSY